MKNNLKEVRKKIGLTLEDLANLCGVSKSQLHDLEQQDGAEPRITTAYSISAATGSSIHYLWPEPEQL